MLAAQCVCGILQAEHSVIRQAVSTVADVVQSKQWRGPGPGLDRLRSQLQYLRVFNRLCHGPKDKHLWQPLWGRSDEADVLLGSLEYAHERNADLLWRALTLLHSVERGNEDVSADLLLTLKRHRMGMLKQMELEEQRLLRLARQLLREEEWAGVASSISSIPCPDGHSYDAFASDESPGDDGLTRLVAPAAAQAPVGTTIDSSSD